MSQDVPATTAIKRNRVHHIETARLLERQAHMVAVVVTHLHEGSRNMFAMRALELRAIEDELEARGESIERRTLTAGQCAALSS